MLSGIASAASRWQLARSERTTDGNCQTSTVRGPGFFCSVDCCVGAEAKVDRWKVSLPESLLLCCVRNAELPTRLSLFGVSRTPAKQATKRLTSFDDRSQN